MATSGSTQDITRRGFVGAAAGAAAFAGASIACGAAYGSGVSDPSAVEWDEECDVLVAGFGFSGCSAAIEAADNGAKVIVLEKAPEEYAGGNSSCCGGGNNYCDEEHEEEAFLFERQLMPVETVSDDEIRGFCHEMATGTAWKEAHGGEVESTPGTGGRYKNFPHAAGLNWKEYTFQNGFGEWTWISGVAKDDENIEVKYGTPMRKLIFDPETKEVFGAIATDPDGNEIKIKAKRGVVLGTGGFECNKQMLTSYFPPEVPIYTCGTPYNTGDGIDIVEEVGARLRHFSSIEWGCHCCKPASDEMGCAIGMRWHEKEVWADAIMVNAKGRRFVNETAGTYGPDDKSLRPIHDKSQIPEIAFSMEELAYANLPMFMIMDSKKIAAGPIFNGCDENTKVLWAHVRGLYTWSNDNQAEIDRGWIQQADTIEELAEKLGIDPDGLAETIERYNEDAYDGEDTEFEREICLDPIDEGPFYGCELGMSLINTQGGPARDAEHRVLDTDGNPVPRLYAGGEFGSIFGFLYHGAGNVPEAFGTRVAGANAAQAEPWD